MSLISVKMHHTYKSMHDGLKYDSTCIIHRCKNESEKKFRKHVEKLKRAVKGKILEYTYLEDCND